MSGYVFPDHVQLISLVVISPSSVVPTFSKKEKKINISASHHDTKTCTFSFFFFFGVHLIPKSLGTLASGIITM